MKVFALTFGDENCPSTNYRLIQFKKLLINDGIELDHEIAKSFKDFKKLSGYDLVILQKTILSSFKIRRIAKYAKRLIYDADDRIWLRPSKNTVSLLKFASITECGPFVSPQKFVW